MSCTFHVCMLFQMKEAQALRFIQLIMPSMYQLVLLIYDPDSSHLLHVHMQHDL